MSDEDEFLNKLQCEADTSVKVVCIVGRAGSGKSFTLNHTLFDSCEVFLTKSSESLCDHSGVWAAHDAVHEAVVLDTQGWLGNSCSERQHIRLLLKVYAYTFECRIWLFLPSSYVILYAVYSDGSSLQCHTFNTFQSQMQYIQKCPQVQKVN